MTSIEEIAPSVKWLRETPGGSIRITDATYMGNPLPAAARLALALSEECCEQGVGKIYWTIPHPTTYQSRKDEGLQFSIRTALGAVAENFYVPEAWTSQEQEEYRAISPYERLHRLSSRHGWVPDWEPVLPFALELCDVDKQARCPSLSGVSEELLTVLVSPVLYIGLTEDIRAICRSRWSSGNLQLHNSYLYTGDTGSWKTFEQWKVGSARELLENLKAIYENGIPGFDECTQFLHELHCRILQAAHNVAVTE